MNYQDTNVWRRFYRWPTLISISAQILMWTIIGLALYATNPQPVTMARVFILIVWLRYIDVIISSICLRIRNGLIQDRVLEFAQGKFQSVEAFNQWAKDTPPKDFDKAIGDDNFKGP